MSKLVDILGGNVLKSVGEILDNLNTSKEEKLLAKQAMKDLLVKAESQAQEQVSRSWEADMKAAKPIYQTLLITVYAAYFAGRSIEKIKK